MSAVTKAEATEVAALPEGFGATTSLAVNLARAEVDQQIATAHAFPRSIKRAVDQIMTLATLDEETAAECVYALPRGGKPIKGPSIRLAEIIAGQWGNARVGARVVHVDRIEKYVEAEGVFHDLETNVATTSRVRRRISDKRGGLLTDDMIIVTGNAASAIAKRNAILGAVPKAVWRRAYGAVESVIAGDVKTLSERRERAMKAFAAFGVKPEQVFAALGIVGADDINLDHMSTLMGMHSALKSGEATVEEMFPRQPVPGERPKNLADALDKLAGPPHDPETGEVIDNDPPAEAGNEAPAAASRADEATQARSNPPASRSGEAGGDNGTPPATAAKAAGKPASAPEKKPEPDKAPTPTPHERGRDARETGRSRKAVPPEWRTEEFAGEAEAWLAGWDEREAELAGAAAGDGS